MTSPFWVIRMRQVEKVYQTHAGPPVNVLSGIDLQVGPGESLAIIGPSGSGKSTLLNMLGALDKPTKGQIWLGDTEITSLNEIGSADFRSREIGFVFQLHHLLPQCTVLENVMIPTIPHPSKEKKELKEKAASLLERVGLADKMLRLPGQLSGGERQRVAVVRALINSPKVLLADEPTGSLDRNSAINLVELLVEINRENKMALVVVTHSGELAEKMDRQLELINGVLRPVS